MSNFTVHGLMGISNFGGFELEVNEDGSAIRIRESYSQKNTKPSDWLILDYDIDGDAWFEYQDDIYYLNQFMRVEME